MTENQRSKEKNEYFSHNHQVQVYIGVFKALFDMVFLSGRKIYYLETLQNANLATSIIGLNRPSDLTRS